MTRRAVFQTSLQIIAVVLLTLGAANSYWATVAETCTQSAADSMLAGVLSIPLYILAYWLLLRRPLPLAIVPMLLPAFMAIVYEVWWTALFGYQYLIHATAVCDLITGYGPFELDGREPFYLAVWIALGILGTGGMAAILVRAGRDIRRMQT